MRRRLLQSSVDEWVDLGLPSGTLWARRNIGARNEYDSGLYFQWGDTVGYAPDLIGTGEGQKSFDWESYKYCNGTNTTLTKYVVDSQYGTVDGKVQLEPSDDAATVNLGEGCRTPSLRDYMELGLYCAGEIIDDYNNITGLRVIKLTSNINNNYIIIPYANNATSNGISSTLRFLYHTCEIGATDERNAVAMLASNVTDPILSFTAGILISRDRCLGTPIRAIKGPVKGYTIHLTDPTYAPTTVILKFNGPSKNHTADEDIISWIHENTKIVAAELNLSNGRLICKETLRTDKTKYKDGTSITMSNVDLFVKLPEFWWRCVYPQSTAPTNDIWKVQFSKEPVYEWNHWEGNTFIGVYEGFFGNSTLYSRTGMSPHINLSQADFKTYARNRGAGYTLISYEAHCMMALLGYGWIGQTDVQSVCGRGTNSKKPTGGCNSLGITDTVAGGNGDSGSTNFWGIENWWGNISEFIDNVKVYNSNRVIAILDNNGNFVRQISTGLTNNSIACTGRMKLGEYGDLVPIEIHSNSSYNDGYCGNGGVYSTVNNIAYRSGYGNLLNGGLSNFIVTQSDSWANPAVGSRLQYKGSYIIDTGKLDPEISWDYSDTDFDQFDYSATNGFRAQPIISNPHNLNIEYGTSTNLVWRDSSSGHWYCTLTKTDSGREFIFAHFLGNDTYNECFIVSYLYYNNEPT